MCTVQNTSVSPDGKLVAVLGDSAECLIADTQSGKVSCSICYYYLCVFGICGRETGTKRVKVNEGKNLGKTVISLLFFSLQSK